VKSFQPLILVGPSGSGKSTLAALVAQELNIEHFDSDALIVQMEGRSISKIFETEGEAYFRQLETKILTTWQATCFAAPTILATGGGLPAQGRNMSLLKTLGLTIYLKATPPTLARRLLSQQEKNAKTCGNTNEETRPLLAGSRNDFKSLTQRIENLLSLRRPIYEEAHRLVDTEEKSPEQLAREIGALLTSQSINIS
jgi:shikimate kinase